jgi:hypothetical protein
MFEALHPRGASLVSCIGSHGESSRGSDSKLSRMRVTGIKVEWKQQEYLDACRFSATNHAADRIVQQQTAVDEMERRRPEALESQSQWPYHSNPTDALV